MNIIILYDTAGLRDTEAPIEKEGTRRSIELSMNADIIIYILNANDGLTVEDKENMTNIKPESKLLIIINKIDLNPDTSIIEKEIKSIIIKTIKYKIVKMSALLEKGLDNFNAKFVEILLDEKQNESEDPILTNSRTSYNP